MKFIGRIVGSVSKQIVEAGSLEEARASHNYLRDLEVVEDAR